LPKQVEAIERHDFPALRELRWRNAALDLESLDGLIHSLDLPAPFICLKKTGNALDHVSLKMLGRRDDVQQRAAAADGVKLLWSVCQIPDFRKTLTDAHLNLLETVFGHLADRGRLPTDWVADQIQRLDRIEGDIDALTTRLAHVRTWTYVAHRADWLADSNHWQERARAVEDRLSDALHERLTQRFVDRRTQLLLKNLREGGPLGAVTGEGRIVVEGHEVGRIEGLTPVLQIGAADIERRTINAAARRVLGPELARRAKALIAAGDGCFSLDDDARILWQPAMDDATAASAAVGAAGGAAGAAAGAPVGRLLAGATPLTPRIEPLVDDQLGGEARDAVRRRLAAWLNRHLEKIAAPLKALERADLEGPGRGLAFLLIEGLGNVDAETAAVQLKSLGADDRQKLSRQGVRFGVRHLYLTPMLKGHAIGLRARLLAVHRGAAAFRPPPPGRVTLPLASLEGLPAQALGFEIIGPAAIRIDIVERLAAALRARARDGTFTLDPGWMALSGLGAADLASVVEALGYAGDEDGNYRRSTRRGRRPKHDPRKKPVEPQTSPFAVLRSLQFQTP
jgi:ATP-dependent RNA helicase SUPV3L1/SUV3